MLDALWERLGIRETLTSLLKRRSHETDVERLLFALVANRALDFRSKLGVERWVGRRVPVEDLEVSVHALYRAMDFLVEHAEAVQEAVFFSVATLLNLEVGLLFETTSTYFEMEEEDEAEAGLRRFGHPKDHRPDLKQLLFSLTMTADGGVPVQFRCADGNTNDSETHIETWEALRAVAGKGSQLHITAKPYSSSLSASSIIMSSAS